MAAALSSSEVSSLLPLPLCHLLLLLWLPSQCLQTAGTTSRTPRLPTRRCTLRQWRRRPQLLLLLLFPSLPRRSSFAGLLRHSGSGLPPQPLTAEKRWPLTSPGARHSACEDCARGAFGHKQQRRWQQQWRWEVAEELFSFRRRRRRCRAHWSSSGRLRSPLLLLLLCFLRKKKDASSAPWFAFRRGSAAGSSQQPQQRPPRPRPRCAASHLLRRRLLLLPLLPRPRSPCAPRRESSQLLLLLLRLRRQSSASRPRRASSRARLTSRSSERSAAAEAKEATSLAGMLLSRPSRRSLASCPSLVLCFLLSRLQKLIATTRERSSLAAGEASGGRSRPGSPSAAAAVAEAGLSLPLPLLPPSPRSCSRRARLENRSTFLVTFRSTSWRSRGSRRTRRWPPTPPRFCCHLYPPLLILPPLPAAQTSSCSPARPGRTDSPGRRGRGTSARPRRPSSGPHSR